MSNIDQQMQEIEVNIEDARKAIAKKEALMRLNQNEDFKNIILEGFFKDDAARAVAAMANPETFNNREAQTMFQNRIISIGDVQQYFRYILQHGYNMEQAMQGYEETRDELAEEALNS